MTVFSELAGRPAPKITLIVTVIAVAVALVLVGSALPGDTGFRATITAVYYYCSGFRYSWFLSTCS